MNVSVHAPDLYIRPMQLVVNGPQSLGVKKGRNKTPVFWIGVCKNASVQKRKNLLARVGKAQINGLGLRFFWFVLLF